jgi:DNA primase
MISRETINQVREKTDIAALIESKGVSLRRVGSRYVGLCPVHSERSPSFNVNTDSQTYHCFGCGISGDAIAFMQEVDGYSFVGAVEYLAELADISIENTEGEDPDYLRKKDYMRCVGQAAWFYQRMFTGLDENHPAKQNLAGRNYLEVEGRETWLEDFGMGFAPDSYDMLTKFLMKQEFTEEQIIDAGLAFRSDKTGKLIDRFRNRLMWVIRNIQGKPIGFSGRRLNEADNPKYLNTSQTIMYNKSKVLYGLDLAKKKMSDDKTCFVVEGAADVMALAAVGATNTVASCGTAFGSDHAAIIRRIIDDFDSQKNGKFVFVFDGDAAGVKAALRVFEIKPSIRERAYVVPIEDGDPVDFRVAHGDEALYKRLMENRVPITEFVIRNAMKNYNLAEVEGRQGFAREALQIISSIEEVAIYESYKRQIAFLSGISLEHLAGNVRRQTTPAKEENDYKYDPWVTSSVPKAVVKKTGQPDPFGEIPEYEPEWSEEFPPDDGGDGYSENYGDPFGSAEVSYTPVINTPEPIPQHGARSLTVAETNEKTILATLLQFPSLAYPEIAKNPDAAEMFTNEDFKNIFYEAVALISYDINRGAKPAIKVSDFTDEKAIIELFHLPLSLTDERVAGSIKRMLNTLDKLAKKRHNENLRAKVAREMAMDSSEDLSLLAEIVKNRKK